jgi:hypothetical protein
MNNLSQLTDWKAVYKDFDLRIITNRPSNEIQSIALDLGIMNKEDFGPAESEEIIRAKIDRLERYLLTLPQIEPPLKHTFTSGIYSREIFIPKGTVMTGKIHRHDHLNFVSMGDVTVLTKQGLSRIKGPCTMVSIEGTKRALYAHEDTIWTTIHANPNEERDLDKLEEFIIAPTYDDLAIEYRKFEVMP